MSNNYNGDTQFLIQSLKYIKNITIYPFGGVTKLEDKIDEDENK